MVSGYPDTVITMTDAALPADPLEALRELAKYDDELQRLRRGKVRAARAAGASWEHIGAALGMTRQSAWEHYAGEVWDDVAASVADSSELSDADALSLAVDEVKVVRRSRRTH
jgi:hypothetical protein